MDRPYASERSRVKGSFGTNRANGASWEENAERLNRLHDAVR
jgi:hypothetical protein